ncbi:MAG TPA: VWA domain-containing protein [Candidatus Saccharimonadales bacterium]|nr:VWA domain-containing protein [Candidatus Saccharimonadales bacterium]
MRTLTLVLPVFFLAFPALAQQPADPAQKPAASTISVKVKEVNLIATVRDKKGQPVNSLGKQDFVLEQDGRPQAITQFATQSDAPLTFGVLADTGPGQRKALAEERKAGTEFVNRLLREGKDKAFVLHFDKEVELLQDVTTSHEKLAKGVDQISVGEQPRNTSNTGRKRDEEDREHPHFFFGGSMLYDAIFLSSDELLKNQPGRKAIVLFSDGQDRASKTSLDHAIESAQRADTLVYCVYVESEHDQQQDRGMRRGGGGGGGYPGGGGPFPGGGGGYPGGGGRRPMPEERPREDKGAGKKVLQRIAKETGAKYFEVSKKLTPEQIYAQIEDELRHQYSLSYTPDKAEGGYHKLNLATKNADLTVQTREGFYSE